EPGKELLFAELLDWEAALGPVVGIHEVLHQRSPFLLVWPCWMVSPECALAVTSRRAQWGSRVRATIAAGWRRLGNQRSTHGPGGLDAPRRASPRGRRRLRPARRRASRQPASGGASLRGERRYRRRGRAGHVG